MAILKNQMQLAREQWDRYISSMTRGHLDYQKQAKLNEKFYLGGGRQWAEDVKNLLDKAGRPWLEENIIFSTINTVLGYQTQSRMDISYRPREADDQKKSEVLSKIGMYIVDQNKFPWMETQVFSDGLIQQRGYFDIRMDFNDNIYGDIKITTLDPLDVIPDQDAKSYDPDDWGDVQTTDWIALDDIKTTYGLVKWRKVQQLIEGEPDFGSDELGEERNKFGNVLSQSAYYIDSSQKIHVRTISRQYWKLQNREFLYDIDTGDLIPVPDNITKAERKSLLSLGNYEIIKKLTKRVRWTVSTKDVILHDQWSPYDHFTIVPYFPYFRRGITLGLVDNLIKTQEMLNKVYSQILHIVNSTANSGWIVQEGSLVNMDVEDLEEVGSQTGLILEYKNGREKPAKIEPNQIPTGLKDLVTSAVELIRLISGVSETFQGGKGPEVSGEAIQSRVHQAAVQLAAPIDNLFRTRNLIADRLLKLMQQYFTEKRTFLITGTDEKGEEVSENITINGENEDGDIINDITVGKYDVVIADVPTQITFQNAQFSQALEMRKFGVAIPDDEMVRLSTLSRKNEIAKKLEKAPSQEQMQVIKEQQNLELQSLKDENKKLKSAAYKDLATVAKVIAENPNVAVIMDRLAKVSGIDSDEEPEVLTTESPQLDTDRTQLGVFSE